MQKLTDEQVMARLAQARQHAASAVETVGQVKIDGVVIISKLETDFSKWAAHNHTFGSSLLRNDDKRLVRKLEIDGVRYSVTPEVDKILLGIMCDVREINRQKVEMLQNSGR